GSFSEAQWQRQHGTASRLAEIGGPKTEDGRRQAKLEPAQRPAPSAPAGGGKKTKEQKRAEAEARNALYRAMKGQGHVDVSALDAEQQRRALGLLEAEIAAKEAEKEAIEQALADPNLYQDPKRFSAEMARFTEAETALEALYQRWEKLAEQVAS